MCYSFLFVSMHVLPLDDGKVRTELGGGKFDLTVIKQTNKEAVGVTLEQIRLPIPNRCYHKK